MNNLSNIFLFLTGLLWATSLSSFSKYRPFDTTKLNCKENLFRFLISNLLINIIPITYMLILYFLFDPIVITIMNMILVVLSAFFIFGTIRIYHAIVFTNYWKYFYSEKQKQEITDLIPSEVKDKFANHFFPGIIYYLIGILASITIIICASFNRA